MSVLVAILRRAPGIVELRCPAVGRWWPRVLSGSLIRPGVELGRLSVLGRLHTVVAPPQVEGVVTGLMESGISGRPMPYDGMLMGVGTKLALQNDAATEPSSTGDGLAADESTGWFVQATTSGRFFSRPSPDKPAFVEVGAILSRGQVLGLLEVMKTFTRLRYDDSAFPENAQVVTVLVEDGEDVNAGDPLFELATSTDE